MKIHSDTQFENGAVLADLEGQEILEGLLGVVGDVLHEQLHAAVLPEGALVRLVPAAERGEDARAELTSQSESCVVGAAARGEHAFLRSGSVLVGRQLRF